MTDADLKKLTLVSAARMIRRKEISPVELTESVLARIARLNERMRAYITVTEDHARTRARAAERALSRRSTIGPIHGVPISLKDLFDTKGIRTTAGSKVLADRVPEQDATVVERLNKAGAVLVGKANMHEFAFGATTVNPHYGTARNPWDPDRVAGGSSGGSASSLALSLAFGSLGSDTGGSIRIPAAACGIVGLKPTYGRVSLFGAIPLSWSLDHIGPMTQTVEDAAVMLEVIAGHDPRDPYSRDVPVPQYTRALTGNIKGLRVGIPRSFFFEKLVAEVETAVRSALRIMEKLGARLVEIDIPNAPLNRAIFSNIASPEAASYHEPFLRAHADLYGPEVRNRLEAGRLLLSIDYVRAQRARTALKEEFKVAFKTADVIVTPTLPIPAPRIDQPAVQWGNETEAVLSTLTRYTRLFNVVGVPTVSLPCGFTSEGLPIGLQIAGKPFGEGTVLRAAHAYEQEAGWFERRPTI